MRLIDADILKEQCHLIPDPSGKYYGLNIVEEYEIDEQPTVCDIDAIRAEIKALDVDCHVVYAIAIDDVLKIIDKHIAE